MEDVDELEDVLVLDVAGGQGSSLGGKSTLFKQLPGKSPKMDQKEGLVNVHFVHHPCPWWEIDLHVPFCSADHGPIGA